MRMRKILGSALVSLGALASGVAGAATCFATNPLDSMHVTSPFGQRFHPKLKEWRCHCGIDLRARTPLPMKAVDAGRINKNGFHSGGGNMSVLGLSNGVVVEYMHASSLLRQQGDSVAAGQAVGYTGNTGEWTTGPHLHFVTKVGGKPVDPTQFLCSGVTQDPSSVLPPPPPGVADPNAPVQMPGGVSGINVPAAQDFPHMDDMAIRDFLYTETHKRFANPQWYLELENPGAMQAKDPQATADAAAAVLSPKIHMYRELNTMMAISNLLAAEIRDQREAIEAELAVLLSIDAKNYAEKVQAITRAQVGKTR